MHTAILRYGILLALSLGASAATAQTELFFATGVDSTGRALAQSNADGHVLIESPQYPHGLWLHLANEAGDALTGIRVEYQGRPDSLVAIRCVDPVGEVQETLVWTRADGTLLRLMLKPKEAADLPAGLVSIDWQIDTSAEFLLEPVETRLIGREAVAAFLRKRWHDQTGRLAMQLDTSTLAVRVDHPEDIETLVAHLKQMHRPAAISLEEKTALHAQVFRGGFASLRESVILYPPLFADANLESMVRKALGRSYGPLTPKVVASLTKLRSNRRGIDSLVGLEHLTALQRLELEYNRITDLTPLSQLKNLELLNLSLRFNQIADLTPLSQLKNLNWLFLNSNQIVDLTPLNQLKNLNSLGLDRNQIADLTPLGQLTNLYSLRLDVNQIVDLTPLNQLKNLRTLSLDRNQIADLTPLSQLKNLELLNLRFNQIVDLTPLNQLKNLRTLSLRFNQIVDIPPLNQLNNLQNLSLSNNQIKDLTPLVASTSIGEGDSVDLRGNPLSAQSRNEHIPALQARGVTVHY